MADMALSVQECIDHIHHALGGPPASEISSLRIVNEAGRKLWAMHPWKFNQAQTASLDFVADTAFVELPTDVIRVISLYMTDSLVKHVEIVSLDELLELRSSTVAISNLQFWVAIAHVQAASGAGAPRPVLEIFPTPANSVSGEMTMFYRAGWPEMDSDQDLVNIPKWIEPVYIQMVREVALGYEEGDMISMGLRMQQVRQGEDFRMAVRQDGMIQPDYGVMRGGAVEEMQSRLRQTGSWGFLVAGPS